MAEENSEIPGPASMNEQPTNHHQATSKLHLLYKSTGDTEQEEQDEENKKDEQSTQEIKQNLQQNQLNFSQVLRMLLPGLATANENQQKTPEQIAIQGQINKFLSNMKDDDKINKNFAQNQEENQKLNKEQENFSEEVVQNSEQKFSSFDSSQSLQQMKQGLLVIQQQMIEDEERMVQLLTKRGEIFQAQLGFLDREIKQIISKLDNAVKERQHYMEKFYEKQVQLYQLAEQTLTKDVMTTLIEMTINQSQNIVVKILQKQKENAHKQFDIKQEFANLVQQQIVVPFLERCKQFEENISKVLAEGWNKYLQELDTIKSEVLASRSQSMNKLSKIEEGFGEQLEEFIVSIDYKIQQSIFKGSTIEDLMGDKGGDPQVVIQALLEADQVDDAFRQCLTCKDSQVLSWMLAKLSPEQTLSTLQITQPVLIGLVLQISMFLSSQDDWSIFLKWLQEALFLLDENDRELGVYMKKYLQDAYATLQQCPKDNLSMEQHRNVLISLHLMNSKLRSLELQEKNNN